jgi:hypothetical protein
MFFGLQNGAPKHHDLPRFHHKLTSKKPRSNTRFCQNPQQKRTITTGKIKRPDSIPIGPLSSDFPAAAEAVYWL